MYLRLDNPGIEKVAFNQIIKFFIQYTGKKSSDRLQLQK